MFSAVANFPLLDLFAVLWFFALWVGYAYYTRHKAQQKTALMSVTHDYRKQWMMRVIEREHRIVDSSILANLSNSSTFFASTTLLILGGLLAMLGTLERIAGVVAELPFTTHVSERLWEIKVMLLIAIFVYAFFKFTWSLRQFNFCAILVGAAPTPTDQIEQHMGFINRTARLASLAGDCFNDGLRAYYFGLAALTWFLNPWVFLIATAWVVLVLYLREFRSNALRALTED